MWSCILENLLKLLISSRSSVDSLWFFYVGHHVICEQKNFYFFFSIISFLHPFLPLLCWWEHPVLFWIAMVRVDNIVFLTLGESMQSFTIKFDVSCSFCRCSISSCGSSLIVLIFWEFLLWILNYIEYFSLSTNMIVWFSFLAN